MKANSEKTKQSNKATHRVLAGVLCGASVLSLVLSLVMPPISQAIANDGQAGAAVETVADEGSLGEDAGAANAADKSAEDQNSDETEGGETSGGTVPAGLSSDDAEAEGAAQPVDDGTDDENATAPASVNADDYIEIQGDVTSGFTNRGEFTNGGSYCLTSDAWSTEPITISQNTTIDLAGHKLYFINGNNDINAKNCTFITIENRATLTVEGAAKDVVSDAASSEPGQVAKMQWSNSTPQSLTYYVTESTPDGLGTSEKTYQHTVTDFGAIVACKEGHVNQVISVLEGGTLNLKGGMITTPRTLGNDGHVILSQGAVNISGGYVTNGNGGGWGGGLCVTGAKASLNMIGGVIAANMAASGGGVYADSSATLNLSGGVISGNATYRNPYDDIDHPNNGYGGGVFTKNADVTINGTANITNNRVNSYITMKYNNGLLGGGGIACTNYGKLTMTGGSVTANYSYEAGGGIYAGFHNQPITFSMAGGTIAGNESANAEGGGLRISSGTTGVIEAASAFSKVYITNNKTMTGSTANRGGDWGGGGIFIQKNGRLNILKSLITDNKAGGWSGGIGACPTGETIVSHSDGAAIYNNTDNVDQDDNHLDTPHYSAGGDGKTEDSDEENYVTDLFKKSGHKDFFLVRNKNDADKTIAVVLGKMLGGGSAGWKGTCDGNEITIDPNGGAEAKYMFGLEAQPSDQAIKDAKTAATTIISGNYSYTHGGGIMTNGDLIVGDVTKGLNVHPNMKLNATKVLIGANGKSTSLEGHAYKFQLLRQEVNGTKAPSWKDDGTFDMGDCSGAGEATVDQSSGRITFDSGKDYSSGQYVFYLVEEPVSGANELDTRFDKTIYKIAVTVGNSPDRTEYLMRIPIKYYTVEGVAVYKKAETDSDFVLLDSSGYSFVPSEDKTEATVTIGNGGVKPTFTNKIVPYASSGSWAPKATKVVEGGEMKEFTLQLAADKDFTKNVQNKSTQPAADKSQTLSFGEINYTLDDLTKGEDATGRGANKTFTYYVREQPPTTSFTNYTYDKSIYKITVNATDQSNKTIKCEVTYTKIVDADGKEIPEAKQKAVDYVPVKDEATGKNQSVPVFTNTYSTSLPLSGMSGVTLTYLAGAAVLCAAAAWMHIRRKANAKGGERRE